MALSAPVRAVRLHFQWPACTSSRSLAHRLVARRAFTASASRQSHAYDAAIAAPIALLDLMHAAVPWSVALPATAILVRGVLVYYLSARPMRKSATMRQTLAPLAHAKVGVAVAQGERLFTMHPERAGRFERRTLGVSPLSPLRRLWYITKELHYTGKPFGAPLLRPLSVVNFAMFLTAMEAIRAKCGMRQGLLSLALGSRQVADVNDTSAASTVGAHASHATVESADELLAQRFESIIAAKQAEASQQHGTTQINAEDVDLTTESSRLAHIAEQMSSPYFDTTLQTEGFAWLTDLTVPDPYGALPCVLAASVAASTLFRATGTQRAVVPPDGGPLAFLTVQQRIGLTLAMIMLFASTNFPAGMTIYWISSNIVAWLQSRWLDIRYPMPQPILPCKRPLRTKAQTSWRNV